MFVDVKIIYVWLIQTQGTHSALHYIQNYTQDMENKKSCQTTENYALAADQADLNAHYM